MAAEGSEEGARKATLTAQTIGAATAASADDDHDDHEGGALKKLVVLSLPP